MTGSGTCRGVLLDLFCGAGGASMGYHRAGWEVVGVDIRPQPRYPFEFHRMDWSEGLHRFAGMASLIHASPPCQGYSAMNNIHRRQHPRLIGEIRHALEATGRPWVIENVEGARPAMVDPVTLCGASLGLLVIRHRLFESPVPITVPPHQPHVGTFYSPAGHGDPNRRRRRLNPHLSGPGYTERCRLAMDIWWMNRDELAEAIPPAYTAWIGRQIPVTV